MVLLDHDYKGQASACVLLSHIPEQEDISKKEIQLGISSGFPDYGFPA